MQLLEQVLGSSVWQFVAVVLALLSLVVTLLHQRKKKRIKWDIAYLGSILNTRYNNVILKDLILEINGKRATDPYLVIMKIENCGHEPIRKEDYAEALKFNFDESLILSAEIKPNEFGVELTSYTASGHLELSPFLLNPKEYIQIVLILDNFSGKVKPSIRIAGAVISGPKRIRATKLSFIRMIFHAFIYSVYHRSDFTSAFDEEYRRYSPEQQPSDIHNNSLSSAATQIISQLESSEKEKNRSK